MNSEERWARSLLATTTTPRDDDADYVLAVSRTKTLSWAAFLFMAAPEEGALVIIGAAVVFVLLPSIISLPSPASLGFFFPPLMPIIIIIVMPIPLSALFLSAPLGVDAGAAVVG